MIAITAVQSLLRPTRVIRLVFIAATAALLVIGVASARASSLVYVHADNVWLANADGSGQYQVTLDGTPGEPYSSPSQAQDGTIEAERAGKLYRMTQNGTLLNPPFTTSALGTGPLDPLISPDGSKVSFWSVTGVNPCYPFVCVGTARSYQVTYSDHWVDPTTFAPKSGGWSSFGAPTWVSNSRQLLFTGNANMWYYDLGQAEPVKWFEWSDVLPVGGSGETGFWEEGASSSDGARLALLALSELTHRYEIQIFSASGDLAGGNPPALPHAACAIGAPDGSVGTNTGTYPGSGSLFDSLSWSPDGSSLAYEYNGAIYVADIASVTNCEEDTVTQVLAGSDPDWGPASVNPAPRPSSHAVPSSPSGTGVNTPPSPPGPTNLCTTPCATCSGLSGTAIQSCLAEQSYRSALATCDRKYHSSSKSAKRQRAACRSRAKAAYTRKLALIRCSKIVNRHKRAQCVKKATR